MFVVIGRWERLYEDRSRIEILDSCQQSRLATPYSSPQIPTGSDGLYARIIRSLKKKFQAREAVTFCLNSFLFQVKPGTLPSTSQKLN